MTGQNHRQRLAAPTGAPEGIQMRISEDGMGSAFNRWQALTDAYARSQDAMFRHEPGAAAELERLARDIEKCETDFLEFNFRRGPGH